MPPRPGIGRTASLDNAIRNNLPPLPRPAQAPLPPANKAPVITLGPVAPPIGAPGAAASDKSTAANMQPAPAPDIGDSAPPAIVPLAPTISCGGV